MDAHTVVSKWDGSPFDGGLEEAARMASRGFSGAVRSGSDWLFLVDGDPVAVVTDLEGDPSLGDVDAFDGAGGEAFEAPHPGVARLVPMLALGGEVRGQYFSDDTSIETVQETLADGGFTGYVELSENVLSGDYYVVFEDGRAEYVGFVGSTEQLYTGTAAEEKTKNEVGIYSVVAVDLPDVALPEPPDGAVGGAGADAATGTADRPSTEADADGSEADASSEPARDADAATGPAPDDEPGAEPTPDEGLDVETGSAVETAVGAGEGDAATGTDGASTDDAASSGTDGPTSGRSADGDPGDADATSERTVPSVDPDRTGRGEEGSSGRAGGNAATDASLGAATGDDAPEADRSATGEPGGASGQALGDLRGEVRELRSTIDRLEERIAAIEAGDAGAAGAPTGRTDGPTLSPREALSRTTLFVREGTRGGPTLEDAHDGRADRDALASNVGLERHTQFDESGATVDGEPYESFLKASQAHEFVEWLTTDLLFEIRVTDSESALAGLYDAIPAVDRVFFHEAVAVDDGGETGDVEFDVVVRDRNGAPLFVATLSDSRDPTKRDRIETLVTDASDFCAANGSLVGAFAVTASYFEPEALEVAREATTSSLLSREKYRSYVNLTRKNGFHLCLVEAREAALHLTLPEL
jgi:hypothetical protein